MFLSRLWQCEREGETLRLFQPAKDKKTVLETMIVIIEVQTVVEFGLFYVYYFFVARTDKCRLTQLTFSFPVLAQSPVWCFHQQIDAAIQIQIFMILRSFMNALERLKLPINPYPSIHEHQASKHLSSIWVVSLCRINKIQQQGYSVVVVEGCRERERPLLFSSASAVILHGERSVVPIASQSILYEQEEKPTS